MLEDHYTLHGWDKKSGIQTRECLIKLDLKPVADRLSKAGKIK